jgi:hypothetical protein
MTDHVYYDLSFSNTLTTPVQALLFENRSTPLIKNPNDYHLSVVRFTVPTAYIPIFIWPTVGGNLPNNAYFSVTIRYSGVDYRRFLAYAPLNNLSPVDDNYLFVYSYQQFIDSINDALNVAFIAAGGPATAPPFMVYDAPTGLFSLVAQFAYANSIGDYGVFFNAPLFKYFDNFKVIRNGFNQPNGKDIQFFIENKGNNYWNGAVNNFNNTGTPDSYQMIQEYDSLFSWNTARSLLLISNTVPVAQESVNVQSQGQTSTGSNYRRILTDFEFNLQSGIDNNTLRSYIQYAPPGEYRLLTLESNQPLFTFDIQFFFLTADQKIYPLYINPNEYVSVKILFRKKYLKGISL